MEYTKEKWEEIGLLESTPEDRKDATTRILNVGLQHLLDKEEKEKNDDHIPLQTMGIPVLIRITREVNLSDEEVISILDDLKPAIEKYDFTKFNGYNIDHEMEFVHEYCETQLRKFKK